MHIVFLETSDQIYIYIYISVFTDVGTIELLTNAMSLIILTESSLWKDREQGILCSRELKLIGIKCSVVFFPFNGPFSRIHIWGYNGSVDILQINGKLSTLTILSFIFQMKSKWVNSINTCNLPAEIYPCCRYLLNCRGNKRLLHVLVRFPTFLE